MRVGRIVSGAALCAGGVLAVTVGANAVAAVDHQPQPTLPYVTCQTPAETHGSVVISSARAQRGTSLSPSVPGETCHLGDGSHR
jgi:hypothetical protein